jgi:hypothetical protein
MYHNFFLLSAPEKNALQKIRNRETFALKVMHAEQGTMIDGMKIIAKCDVHDDNVLPNYKYFATIPALNMYTLQEEKGINYHGITLIPSSGIQALKDICFTIPLLELMPLFNKLDSNDECLCVLHYGM